MDQMVSSVGGLVSIDFYDTQNPEIERFDFDFEEHGYCLCITDTKGSHENLTDDYVAIRSEMESIAAQLGKPHLREVSEIAFYDAIPKLREVCSDRAILRASHFFSENSRALQEADALKACTCRSCTPSPSWARRCARRTGRRAPASACGS